MDGSEYIARDEQIRAANNYITIYVYVCIYIYIYVDMYILIYTYRSLLM